MAFEIDITDAALADAEDYVRFVRDVEKQPEAAERWFRGLVHAIYSLEELPARCPVIPEQSEFAHEIRHLVYYSHRIIYRVEHGTGRLSTGLAASSSTVSTTALAGVLGN